MSFIKKIIKKINPGNGYKQREFESYLRNEYGFTNPEGLTPGSIHFK